MVSKYSMASLAKAIDSLKRKQRADAGASTQFAEYYYSGTLAETLSADYSCYVDLSGYGVCSVIPPMDLRARYVVVYAWCSASATGYFWGGRYLFKGPAISYEGSREVNSPQFELLEATNVVTEAVSATAGSGAPSTIILDFGKDLTFRRSAVYGIGLFGYSSSGNLYFGGTGDSGYGGLSTTMRTQGGPSASGELPSRLARYPYLPPPLENPELSIRLLSERYFSALPRGYYDI